VSANRFRVEIPPHPEYLGTARAFVSAVARGVEASEESVADLKLAVSEACAIALSPGEPVRIRVSTLEAGLEVAVALRDAGNETDDVERRDIITSLFPDTALVPGADGSLVLTFVAPMG